MLSKNVDESRWTNEKEHEKLTERFCPRETDGLMNRRRAVWCIVVQCGAVCCDVLQCVVVCCGVLQTIQGGMNRSMLN